MSFSLKQNPTKFHTHFLTSGNLSSSFEQTFTISGRKAKWNFPPIPETQKLLPNSPDYLRAQKKDAKPHLSVRTFVTSAEPCFKATPQ